MGRAFLRIALAWVLTALMGMASASAADWPWWRGTNRDAKSPDTGLLKSWPEDGPPLLWKADGLGEGYSGPSVVDGVVYITGFKENNLVLFAFDETGKKLYERVLGPGWDAKKYTGSRATPTVHDGRIYLVSGKGGIYCLDARDGKAIWQKSMADFGGKTPRWGFSESPLIHDGSVIVTPGGKQGMVALDVKTGETRWSSPANGAEAHYCSAIVVDHDGVTMIVNGNRGGLFAVDAKDGALLWSNPWCKNNTANCTTPAYADGYVFWANGYGKGGVCMKLKGRDAEEAWTTKQMNCHHGGYIIHEGCVYGNHAGSWACLDLKTGEKKWNDRGVGKGSVCYADGMLYTFSESRGKMGLVRCTPDAFEMTGQFQVEGQGPSWAHPVVIGGRLYLRYGDNLYAFDVAAK